MNWSWKDFHYVVARDLPVAGTVQDQGSACRTRWFPVVGSRAAVSNEGGMRLRTHV